MFNFVNKSFDWVIKWANSKYSLLALIIFSFLESSISPFPIDFLLTAMCISNPRMSFVYASLASLFSVLGGIFSYVIGYLFMESIGLFIINFYGYGIEFESISSSFRNYNFIATLISAFSPVPYKVFAIGAGAVSADFIEFLVASALGRSARFLLNAFLFYVYGEKLKIYIDNNKILLTIIFIIFLILGIILIGVFF
tara:strand:- start:1258 stop:1848 length:591 start_codon:yes stop_codon:yes gene_type:complete